MNLKDEIELILNDQKNTTASLQIKLDKAHDQINRLETEKISLKKNILDSHGKLELKLSVQTLTEKLRNSKENEINISIEVVKLQSTISRLMREMEDNNSNNNNNNNNNNNSNNDSSNNNNNHNNNNHNHNNNNNNNHSNNNNNNNNNNDTNNSILNPKKSSKQEILNAKSMDIMKSELLTTRSEVQKLKTIISNEKNKNTIDMKKIYNKSKFLSLEFKKIEEICIEFQNEILEEENENYKDESINTNENGNYINENDNRKNKINENTNLRSREDELKKIESLQNEILFNENNLLSSSSSLLQIGYLNNDKKTSDTNAKNSKSSPKINNEPEPLLGISNNNIENLLEVNINKLRESIQILLQYKLENKKQKQVKNEILQDLILKFSLREENLKTKLNSMETKLIEIENLNIILLEYKTEKELIGDKDFKTSDDNENDNLSNSNNDDKIDDIRSDDKNKIDNNNNNNNNDNNNDSEKCNHCVDNNIIKYVIIQDDQAIINDKVQKSLINEKTILAHKLLKMEENFEKERYDNNIENQILHTQLEMIRIKEKRNGFQKIKNNKYNNYVNDMVVKESKRIKENADFVTKYDNLQENYLQVKISLLSAESKIIQNDKEKKNEKEKENVERNFEIAKEAEKEKKKMKEKEKEKEQDKATKDEEREIELSTEMKMKKEIDGNICDENHEMMIKQELERGLFSLVSNNSNYFVKNYQDKYDNNNDNSHNIIIINNNDNSNNDNNNNINKYNENKYNNDNNCFDKINNMDCEIRSPKNLSNNNDKVEFLEKMLCEEKAKFTEKIKILLKSLGMYDGTYNNYVTTTTNFELSNENLCEAILMQINNQRRKILLLKTCLQRLKSKLTPREMEDLEKLGIVLSSKIRKSKSVGLNFGSALCFA